MKVFHFADIHLGHDLYGDTDPITGLHYFTRHALGNLDLIYKAARHEKPDLILFCGDAFKNRYPSQHILIPFIDKVRKLSSIAPMIVLAGNHDMPVDSRKPTAIEILEELGLDLHIVNRDIELVKAGGLAVLCIPWIYMKSDEEKQAVFDQISVTLPVADMVAGHLSCSGFNLTANRRTDDGADPVFHTNLFGKKPVALGHIHKHQGNRNIVYAGSVEGLNFGEPEGKGYVVWTDGEWEFRELESTRFHTVRLGENTTIPETGFVRLLVIGDPAKARALRDKANEIRDTLDNVVSIKYDILGTGRKSESRQGEAFSIYQAVVQFSDRHFPNVIGEVKDIMEEYGIEESTI